MTKKNRKEHRPTKAVVKMLESGHKFNHWRFLNNIPYFRSTSVGGVYYTYDACDIPIEVLYYQLKKTFDELGRLRASIKSRENAKTND